MPGHGVGGGLVDTSTPLAYTGVNAHAAIFCCHAALTIKKKKKKGHAQKHRSGAPAAPLQDRTMPHCPKEHDRDCGAAEHKYYTTCHAARQPRAIHTTFTYKWLGTFFCFCCAGKSFSK